MAEPELRIADYSELLALHRALIEAKFNPDPNDKDVAGSPFVAKTARSVVDALIETDAVAKGDKAVERWHEWLSIDETRREWRIASQRALGTSNWESWTEDERLEYARTLLSPFRPTPERLRAFLTETSSRISSTMDLARTAADGDESAYHTLLELPDEDLGVLIARYPREESAPMRATIVEAVWQHRRQEDLHFLVSAVDDEEPEVWKQALDGLVTLGGQPVRAQLDRVLRDLASDDDRVSWIREALDQIDSGGEPDAEL